MIVFARGRDWYAALFAGAAPRGSQRGEGLDPLHESFQLIPKRSPGHAPCWRPRGLVYMIRNPVERAVSHFIHEWSQGVMSDDMTAEFARTPEIVRLRALRDADPRPWIEEVFAPNTQVASDEPLEAMQADPQRVLSEVAAFYRAPWRGHLGRGPRAGELSRPNASASFHCTGF